MSCAAPLLGAWTGGRAGRGAGARARRWAGTAVGGVPAAGRAPRQRRSPSGLDPAAHRTVTQPPQPHERPPPPEIIPRPPPRPLLPAPRPRAGRTGTCEASRLHLRLAAGERARAPALRDSRGSLGPRPARPRPPAPARASPWGAARTQAPPGPRAAAPRGPADPARAPGAHAWRRTAVPPPPHRAPPPPRPARAARRAAPLPPWRTTASC
jgi:hypothetical protein